MRGGRTIGHMGGRGDGFNDVWNGASGFFWLAPCPQVKPTRHGLVLGTFFGFPRVADAMLRVGPHLVAEPGCGGFRGGNRSTMEGIFG